MLYVRYAKMYATIFLRCNILKSSSVILLPVMRCHLQKVLSQKPTLPHSLQGPFTVRSFGTLNKNVPTLRSNALSRNKKTLAKQSSLNIANVRGLQNRTLNVNTNVSNNVFLYKFERPNLFLFINIFAPFQCVFWLTMAYYFYTTLPAYNSNEQSLSAYIKQHTLSSIVIGSAITLGFLGTAVLWLFSSRSIKYIILNKGGKTVTFLTYHPWKSSIGITSPLENVSSRIPRLEMNNYMTVKVRGRRFFYLLDAGGTFVNTRLFDHTVGFQRF